jgi:hypothetical protein
LRQFEICRMFAAANTVKLLWLRQMIFISAGAYWYGLAKRRSSRKTEKDSVERILYLRREWR